METAAFAQGNYQKQCYCQSNSLGFFWLIVFGFNETSTLEKGRKEIEEIVEEMKDRNREERGTGMKVKKRKK